jgi:hypothetical protein
MLTHHCSHCSFRARYDRNPASLLGRLWKWHIRFCPGWRGYLKSLPEPERSELQKRYTAGR